MNLKLRLRNYTVAVAVALTGFASSADVYTLPVTFTPSKDFLSKECVVVDVAEDGKGESGIWSVVNGEFKYSYEQNKSNPADDWVILPLVNFGENTQVTVSFTARTQISGTEKEDFAVFLGKAQEVSAMTVPVITKPNYVSVKDDEITASVKLPTLESGESNVWCLGFHVYSQPNMYNLYIKDIKIEAGATDVTAAPGKPVIESSNIDELDYTASVKMPSEDVDGEEITGTMTLKVTVDSYPRETYTELEAGAVQAISLTLDEGEHTISYQAVLDDVSGETVSETVTAKKKVTTPVAPVVKDGKVEGGTYTAVVTMPSDDTDGNPISSTMTLQVKEGETLLKSVGDCAAGLDVDVELTLKPGSHTLSFFALLNDVSSAATEETVSVAEPVYDLPYTFNPSKDNFGDCVVIDANNDGGISSTSKEGKWTISEDAFCYTANEDFYDPKDADDWVILPFVNFGNAEKVKVSMSVKSKGIKYPESFEVFFGNERTADGMTKLIGTQTDIINTDYETVEFEFDKGDSDQTKWALGIHAISKKNMYALYIKDIVIEAVKTEADLPGVPEIKSSSVEGNTYTAAVLMPTKTVAGADLTTTLTLTISVDGDVLETKDNLTAGATVDVQFYLAKGSHTVSYLVTDENGDSEAVKDEVNVEGDEEQTGSLPYTFKVTQATFDQCVVLDANNDEYTESGNVFGTWTYAVVKNSSGENVGAFKYTYSNKKDADDWIILPMVDFGNSDNIEISLDVMTGSYSETFELWLGRERTPEGMTVQVGSFEVTSNNVFKQEIATVNLSSENTRAENNEWCLGIHATSTMDHGFLYLKNISFTNRVATSISDELIDNDNSEAEYYNLQGMKIAAPEAGTMVIVKKGNKTSKAIIK